MSYVRVNCSADEAGSLAQRLIGVREYVLRAEPMLGEARDAFSRDVSAILDKMGKAVSRANDLRERAARLISHHRQMIARLQREMESRVSVPSASEDPSGHDRALSYNEGVDRRNEERRREIARRERSISDCERITSEASNASSRMQEGVNGAIGRAKNSFGEGERAVLEAVNHCGNGYQTLSEALLSAKSLLSDMCAIRSPANKMHPLVAKMGALALNAVFVGHEGSPIDSLESIGGERREDYAPDLSFSAEVKPVKLSSIKRKDALEEIERLGYPPCVSIPSSAFAMLGAKTFVAAMREIGYIRRTFGENKHIGADGCMVWERTE